MAQGTGLKIPEANAVSPLVDVTRGAGAGDRVLGEAVQGAVESVADAGRAFIKVEVAQRRAAEAAALAEQKTAIDNQADELHAEHLYDPEGFQEAWAGLRRGVVTSTNPRHAQEIANYADRIGGSKLGSIRIEHARRQHAIAGEGLKARAGRLETDIDDAVSNGDGLAALNDPLVASKVDEWQSTFEALVDGGFMAPEEAAAEIDKRLTGLKASAVTAHAAATYKAQGLDAALAEVEAIGAAPALPPSEGMKTPGNLDPWNRPVLQNPDGSYSTTSSMSVGTDQGEVLIPTVVNGERLTNEQAIEHFRQTGEHLGVFDTAEHADAYATALHNAQAAYIERGSNGLRPHERELARNKALAEVRELAGIDKEQAGIAASQTREAEQAIKDAVDDDVGQTKLTGKGTGLTADKVGAVLGPDGVAKWYKDKADALEFHEKYGDLAQLPPEEAAARIASQGDVKKFPATIRNDRDLDAVLNAMSLVETPGRPDLISRDPDGPGPAGGGAVGDMQLLPGTARSMAKRIGVAYDANRLRTDVAYNRALGKEYLRTLLDRYDGDVFLAVTAYHAGEGNVDAWLKTYGDPRVTGDRDGWLARLRAANKPLSADYPVKVARAMDGGRAAEAWERAQTLRRDDPAAAVATEFSVVAAEQRWKADTAAGRRNSGAGYGVVDAYMRAQERAQIKERDRQPLPNATMRVYATRIAELEAAGDVKGYQEFTSIILRQFADPARPNGKGYGPRVLQAALTMAGASDFSARVGASVTAQAASGQPITPAQAREVNAAGRVETAHRAMNGTMPPPRALPPGAVAELRKDPSAQAQQEFDQVFGSGAAKRVLGGA